MKIFIVRHAESQDGARQCHQKTNSPLSKKGQRQAELIAQRLKDFKIDLLLTSPFPRAKKTAKIIGEKINLSIQKEVLLKEQKRPTEIEGEPKKSQKTLKVKSQIRRNINNPAFHYSDEESFFEFKKRILFLLKRLKNPSQKNILLVTHHKTTKMILSLLIFGDSLCPRNYLKIYKAFVFNKAALTILKHSKKKGWQLLTWNDQVHLK